MALGTRTQSTSNSFSVTVPSGSDRMGDLLVEFEATTAPTVSATLNGVAMTSSGTPAATSSGAGSQAMVAHFHMLEADLPAAGTYTVVVTFTGGTGTQGHLNSYATHTDRAQEAPQYATGAINTGTALNIGPLDTAVDAYGVSGAVTTVGGRTFTVGGSWTEEFDQDGSGGGDTRGAGADITYGSVSTDTVAWTGSVSGLWAGAFVVFDAASGGGGGSTQPIRTYYSNRRRRL
jgi:hypothetical protein